MCCDGRLEDKRQRAGSSVELVAACSLGKPSRRCAELMADGGQRRKRLLGEISRPLILNNPSSKHAKTYDNTIPSYYYKHFNS
jgi:hypothetical protein